MAAGQKALVLSGGGAAGIAWELGVLVGLHESGVDVRAADLIVGTSAGSVVGALVAGGAPLDHILAQQPASAAQPSAQRAEQPPQFDVAAMQEALMKILQTTPPDPQQIRARIGALALSAPTGSESEWVQAIGALLPIKEWPLKRLLISTVDAQTGEWVVFDRNSGVRLVDAVAASCAVPGVWPPVKIGGRRYMDGGVRSLSSADLAKGYERVLILTPIRAKASGGLFGEIDEIALLENSGSRVLEITADEPSRQAMGTNVLDPATSAPSAKAGRAQGLALAGETHKFWA
jgi:NTE family protein